MAETDLSDWLLTMEAAMRIGCSVRTVQRLGEDKKLETRKRPQKGTPPVVVYNPDDVDRIAAEKRQAAPPFVLPPVSTGNGNGHLAHGLTSPQSVLPSTHPVSRDTDLIRQFLALAVQHFQSPPSPPQDVTVAEMAETKAWLTIPEASAHTGLSQAYLRRKCQAGWAGAIKDRGWKIRRTDLEAL